MSEPCHQAEKIGRMEATLLFFQDAEKRRETREERIAVSLETIATQGADHGATIKAHGETMERFEKAFQEMFLRMRKVEGSSLIAKIFTGKRGPYIFASMISLSVYGVTRMDDGTLEKLVKIIKLLTGG